MLFWQLLGRPPPSAAERATCLASIIYLLRLYLRLVSLMLALRGPLNYSHQLPGCRWKRESCSEAKVPQVQVWMGSRVGRMDGRVSGRVYRWRLARENVWTARVESLGGICISTEPNSKSVRWRFYYFFIISLQSFACYKPNCVAFQMPGLVG